MQGPPERWQPYSNLDGIAALVSYRPSTTCYESWNSPLRPLQGVKKPSHVCILQQVAMTLSDLVRHGTGLPSRRGVTAQRAVERCFGSAQPSPLYLHG